MTPATAASLDPLTLYLQQTLQDGSPEFAPRSVAARMQSFKRTLFALTPRTPQFTPRSGGARRIERVRADAAARGAGAQVPLPGGTAKRGTASLRLDLRRASPGGSASKDDLKSPVLSDRSSQGGSPRTLAMCSI